MKIVFLCNEYPPRPHGGIGTFVNAVARGLYQRGHEVTVVGLGEANQESEDEGIRLVTIRRTNLPYVGNLVSRVQLRNWLSSRARAGEVDLIESPDYMGLMPFAVDGCPVVVRLHQTATAMCKYSNQPIPKGIFFYERRTLSKNPNWIGVSHHILSLTQSVFGVSPRRATVIYNPVAPTPSHIPEMPQLPDKFVLYASQVSRRKGAVVAAEAARQFMVSHPDTHLVFAGGISREGNRPISEHILELVGPDLAGRVHFLGHLERARVLACMRRATAFVFPTQIEALGLVALEAMSCGLPVVCTKNPPGTELVEDGVSGLLADPERPSDLSEKVTRLLDDPALRRWLAEKAGERLVERFSLQRCLEATERFYEECLKH